MLPEAHPYRIGLGNLGRLPPLPILAGSSGRAPQLREMRLRLDSNDIHQLKQPASSLGAAETQRITITPQVAYSIRFRMGALLSIPLLAVPSLGTVCVASFL